MSPARMRPGFRHARLSGSAAPTRRLLQPPSRKMFNTIVDDTAVIAGVKRSTRDGIRKWVETGSIRLFVPLHTLMRVNELKSAGGRLGQDAQDATVWLDEVTSMPSIVNAGRIIIEGTDEKYQKWEEVEQYLLPETLFSGGNGAYDEVDSLADDVDSNLSLQDHSDQISTSSADSMEQQCNTPSSSRSAYSSTSPGLLNSTPYKVAAEPLSLSSTPASATPTTRSIAESNAQPPKPAVPPHLQDLFNYIMWLVNHPNTSIAGLDSFILLTNDPAKQSLATRFGIRTKRLEQLRDVIAREERDYKNRMALYNKEMGITEPTSPTKAASAASAASAEAAAAAAMEPKAQQETEDDVVLPFRGRSSGRSPAHPRGALPHTSPRPQAPRLFDPNAPPAAGRGGRGGRGRGSARGRGSGYHMRGGAFIPLSPTPASPAVRTSPAAARNPKQPIDPDDFSRPPPMARGHRGGRKQLWNPS